MEYGICHLALIPGRKEAFDASEMVTQFLFGEQFSVIDRREKWSKVKGMHDEYECWIDNKQYRPIEEPNPGNRSLELFHQVRDLRIPFGGFLPHFTDDTFEWNGERIPFGGSVSPAESVFDHLGLWLGTPYLWGGRSPFGVDCSGFTQILFATVGIQLPRDAYMQAVMGEEKSFGEHGSGDLACFKNDKGRITHVGIIMDEQRIVHASGEVRIDSISEKGILHADTAELTHRLASIKRITS